MPTYDPAFLYCDQRACLIMHCAACGVRITRETAKGRDYCLGCFEFNQEIAATRYTLTAAGYAVLAELDRRAK